MTKNTFDPTWRELLRPIVLPKNGKTPETKPTREPFITKSYVHLAIKFVDHPNDFNKKLQLILEKHAQTDPDPSDIDLTDVSMSHISNYFKIPLEACEIINKDDENLLINFESYAEKVLSEMPAKEFVEYGVIVQTFNLDFPDVFSDCYKKRVNEIVAHFIDHSLVCNGKVRGSGLIQVFLYVHNDYNCKSRLFTQYSTSSSKEYITDIVKDFITHYNSLNELQLLIELLFLNNYNLSKTISINFEALLLETLQKRLFTTAVKEFLSSPIVISATHGLQSMCREIITNMIFKRHINSLINKIKENYDLDEKERNVLEGLFYEVFCLIVGYEI